MYTESDTDTAMTLKMAEAEAEASFGIVPRNNVVQSLPVLVLPVVSVLLHVCIAGLQGSWARPRSWAFMISFGTNAVLLHSHVDILALLYL